MPLPTFIQFSSMFSLWLEEHFSMFIVKPMCQEKMIDGSSIIDPTSGAAKSLAALN
jgi:hypothetical protein